jgi:hypothetical protein
MNLTRKQIENEPAGRQMDIWIAEHVMGWKRMTYKDQYPTNPHYSKDLRTTSYWHDAEGNEKNLAEDCDDYYQPQEAWSPSTNIEEAFEVVEFIGVHNFRLSNTHGSWFCDFDGSKEAQDCVSAPEAICRAALLSKL